MTEDWRNLGDIPQTAYEVEFSRVGSPLLEKVSALWAAARPHSALCLGMLFVESKYGTVSDIPRSFANPLSLAKPDGLSTDGDDRWERYPSDAAGIMAWKERITSPTYKNAIYARTVTLADLINVYAPAHDNNDPARYEREVRGRIAAYQGDESMPTMQTITLAGAGSAQIPADIAFRQELIRAGQTNQRPGILLAGGRADRYTLHETANVSVGAGASMHSRYLQLGAPDNQGRSQQLSYHLTVDDTTIVQMLPLNEVGWHAGDGAGAGNMDSIACELCVNADADRAKARRNAEWLAAAVTLAVGIPTGGIVQHNYWSGKDCPMLIRREGYWPTFLANVAKNRGGAVPTTPSGLTYPPGVDKTLAATWFGRIVGAAGEVYEFGEKGSVSRLWLAQGAKTGLWPKLTSVQVFDDSPTQRRRYFVFSNGMTIWDSTGEPVRLLIAA